MDLNTVKATPFYLDRLDHMGKAQYHAKGFKGKNVVICLIDTGVNAHDEFVGRDINITGDTRGHGTSMASCIVGQNIGIAPEAKVLVYKRNDEYLDSVVAGMKFARAWRGTNGEKVNIISLSVSSSSSYAGIYEEVKACKDAGILIVCSSGNTGVRDITYPSSYDETLSVGSCTNKQEIAKWATSGEMVDICTYGEMIPTANYSNPKDYILSDGTSPATAIVSGLTALYYCRYYSMYKTYPTPEEARRFMMMQSVDLGVAGKDINFGWGFATLTGRINKKIELQMGLDSEPITSMNVRNGSKTMKINGYSTELEQSPSVSTDTGRTLVPLRAVTEALGCSVEWDSVKKVITIKS